MKKRDDNRKRDVPEAGSAPVLKHNPFGALRGASAPAATIAARPAESHTEIAEPAKEPKSRGRLVLRREKKQRGGKTVVIVAGLRSNAHLSESEIAKIAQHLKQQLGCGGAVERVQSDSEIVVQGDQPARIAELLRALRFRVDGVTQ
jgi:translation initiation factor 1 (eIF-1/SUI1)